MKAFRDLNRHWILFENSDMGRRVTGLMTPLTVATGFLILGCLGVSFYRQIDQQLTDLRTLVLEQQKVNAVQQQRLDEIPPPASASPPPVAETTPVSPSPTP